MFSKEPVLNKKVLNQFSKSKRCCIKCLKHVFCLKFMIFETLTLIYMCSCKFDVAFSTIKHGYGNKYLHSLLRRCFFLSVFKKLWVRKRGRLRPFFRRFVFLIKFYITFFFSQSSSVLSNSPTWNKNRVLNIHTWTHSDCYRWNCFKTDSFVDVMPADNLEDLFPSHQF